jgi:hypothetical protein
MSARGCLLGAVLALATCAGPAGAASQLYKCVERGRTIYQQQACAVSPQEAPASAPGLTVHASAASEPAPAGTGKVKRSSPASSAPATPR